MITPINDLKNIRQLLAEKYGEAELRRLCLDQTEFRPVYDSLARSDSKTDIIDKLLEFADRQRLLELVQRLAEEYQPSTTTTSADEGRLVNTGGGAYNEGQINTGGGDFVGRDQINVNSHGGGPVVIAGEGAHVTVTMQGEDLRTKELAYLQGLLAQYEYWRDRYTPLAGIAEVRAAVKDGPRLDLPMPFIPPGFEKLEEHGFGERVEVRRAPVEDLRAAVDEHRRIILLGEPGSGKTTTLWRLVYDYTVAAQADGRAPLPVLVPLGSYADAGPFDDYLAGFLGPLEPYLETYRAAGRLILLLDGLNEMPQQRYAERVDRIQVILHQHPEEKVVVTCRALDYVVKLKGLQPVEISPLDEGRIRTFLHNYLGETAGERLFWKIAGGDEVQALWATWQQAGATFTEFWTATAIPPSVFVKTTQKQNNLWEWLRGVRFVLLELSRNPYLLLMLSQVYVRTGAELPANRAPLFAAFVDVLLGREEHRCHNGWIEMGEQQRVLAGLAYVIQAERGRGTTVERIWAESQLQALAPDLTADRLLYLAASASLLEITPVTVRFHHQLLQEYFTARELERRVLAGADLQQYWSDGQWWKPSGWEVTVILLADMVADPNALLSRLTPVHPVLAGDYLLERDIQVETSTRQAVTANLIAAMVEPGCPATDRALAGDILARLGDPRPGVGLRPDGLPDIAWCEVSAGPFLMGSNKARYDRAYDDELPQHTVNLPAYRIGKYPVTNAQYAAFVRDGGYTEKWRRCWTRAGWVWKGDQVGPKTYGDNIDLSNHPVVEVSWYEVIAFCNWLTLRLRELGELEAKAVVRLPSEAEWEKAARGTDGRIYPWGNEADPNRANYADTGIGTTSAVGCFPAGVSPYGAVDMVGNVWEWCATKASPFKLYPYNAGEDEWAMAYLNGTNVRVRRGGSWDFSDNNAHCAYRYWKAPFHRWINFGFRLAGSPI